MLLQEINKIINADLERLARNNRAGARSPLAAPLRTETQFAERLALADDADNDLVTFSVGNLDRDLPAAEK